MARGAGLPQSRDRQEGIVRRALRALVLGLTLLFVVSALAVSCALVIYTAWPFVRNSWAVWEGSPDPGGIRGRWALKSMIIVGFALLFVQGISETIKAFYRARGWEAADGAPKDVR